MCQVTLKGWLGGRMMIPTERLLLGYVRWTLALSHPAEWVAEAEMLRKSG